MREFFDLIKTLLKMLAWFLLFLTILITCMTG